MSYILFIASINCFVLGLLRLSDQMLNYLSMRITNFSRLPLPAFMAGLEKSMLFIFLLANLMTGGINMSLRPLLRDQVEGFIIIVTYSYAWMLTAYVLGVSDLKVKFW